MPTVVVRATADPSRGTGTISGVSSKTANRAHFTSVPDLQISCEVDYIHDWDHANDVALPPGAQRTRDLGEKMDEAHELLGAAE